MIRLNYNMYDGYYWLKDTVTKDIIGRCTVYEKKDFFEIWGVRILEDFQRQGFTTLMLKRIIKKFKDKPIRLYVYKDNDVAIHLYEKLGFKIIEEYDPYGNGNYSAWTMQR